MLLGLYLHPLHFLVVAHLPRTYLFLQQQSEDRDAGQGGLPPQVSSISMRLGGVS